MYRVLHYLTAWELRGQAELTCKQILIECISQRIRTFMGGRCSFAEQVFDRWLCWLRFMLECIKRVCLMLAAVNRTFLSLANRKLTRSEKVVSAWRLIESIDVGRRLRRFMAAMFPNIMTVMLRTLLRLHCWRKLADAWRLWIKAISCTWEHETIFVW